MVRSGSSLGSTSYWIVVADEFQAHFYASEKKFGPLQEFSSFENETAREKLEDLVSDRGGRSFDSQGAARHTYNEEKSNLKTRSYDVFAKNLAERIREGRLNHKFDKLVVIAAPRFLGVLRKSLEAKGLKPELTIDKDVTNRDAAFIRQLLDEHM